jgi:hypothetical protein
MIFFSNTSTNLEFEEKKRVKKRLHMHIVYETKGIRKAIQEPEAVKARRSIQQCNGSYTELEKPIWRKRRETKRETNN